MKLGEIKIEALKLMFVNYSSDITLDDLDTYMLDENYASYLVNMAGSINRCFANIEEKGVLPVKAFNLDKENGAGSGRFTRFNLSELIDDFYQIDRVVCEGYEYEGDCDYRMEGTTLVLENFEESDKYLILYRPKIKRVTSSTDNNSEIDLPDNIAVNIPYFIKGDLYRDDEPNEASEARNWFEVAMESIMLSNQNKTSRVRSVYSQTE